jgi:simple sugar transport system permease protein
LGIKPKFYQTISFLISGVFCGIGGSFLSLNLGVYVPGMSAGKGWIALAVIFLGVKKPFGILLAAFVFALAESFSNYAQGFLNIPAYFILTFPYVCTLIAMIIVSITTKQQ